MVRTAIVSEPIVPEEILTGLPSSQDGACVLFLGVVRDHAQGRVVRGLDYEVYQGMAEKTLASIAMEASRQFGTDRIAVLHRVGELRVGELSTAIAVATPHRQAAFEASRFILEEIKQRLPIWKREHYLEGDSDWVAGSVAPHVVGERPDGSQQGEEADD